MTQRFTGRVTSIRRVAIYARRDGDDSLFKLDRPKARVRRGDKVAFCVYKTGQTRLGYGYDVTVTRRSRKPRSLLALIVERERDLFRRRW